MQGILSGSIAITADAVNNLSDAGSSFITLIGFKMAGQKPDPQHPFGHGRIEYLSGLIVSAAVLIMAFELIKSSIEKNTSSGDNRKQSPDLNHLDRFYFSKMLHGIL